MLHSRHDVKNAGPHWLTGSSPSPLAWPVRSSLVWFEMPTSLPSRKCLLTPSPGTLPSWLLSPYLESSCAYSRGIGDVTGPRLPSTDEGSFLLLPPPAPGGHSKHAGGFCVKTKKIKCRGFLAYRNLLPIRPQPRSVCLVLKDKSSRRAFFSGLPAGVRPQALS